MTHSKLIKKAFGIDITSKSPNVTLKENEHLIYQLPLSMKEMREKYQLGKLLYDVDWYKDEPFYTEKLEEGWVIITDIVAGSKGKNWDAQEELKPKDYTRTSPAQILYHLALKYAETGEYSQWEYEWSGDRSSGGSLVRVGNFDGDGASVSYDQPGRAYVYLGVSFSRSLNIRTLDTEPLLTKPELNEKISLEITEISVNGRIYRLVENYD